MTHELVPISVHTQNDNIMINYNVIIVWKSRVKIKIIKKIIIPTLKW